MKSIFIINEEAGKGRCKKLVPKIKEVCKDNNIEYEIRSITKTKTGADIAREYADQENIIYVVGGDGTITMTIDGIVGTKNKLAIIPAGSGNDTYRAVKNLPKGETKIDLAKINDKYFINVACIGLDAEVANNLDIAKNMKVPPSQVYNVSIVYTFFNFKFKKIRLKTQTKTIESFYSSISICNGAYYGGGYHVAPKALLTDGILDIYYIEKMPKIRMFPILLKLKKGKHEGKRKIHKYRSKHVEIDLEEEITFNVDGEKVTDKHFVLDVVPKAISYYNDDEIVKKIME